MGFKHLDDGNATDFFALTSCKEKLRPKWPVEFGIHFQSSDLMSLYGHLS
jgi:hypothetical protein